jgi:hypothetical protein
MNLWTDIGWETKGYASWLITCSRFEYSFFVAQFWFHCLFWGTAYGRIIIICCGVFSLTLKNSSQIYCSYNIKYCSLLRKNAAVVCDCYDETETCAVNYWWTPLVGNARQSTRTIHLIGLNKALILQHECRACYWFWKRWDMTFFMRLCEKIFN